MAMMNEQNNVNGKAEGMVPTKNKIINQPNVEMNNPENMSTPIWKKWWFWTLIFSGIVILGLIIYLFL